MDLQDTIERKEDVIKDYQNTVKKFKESVIQLKKLKQPTNSDLYRDIEKYANIVVGDEIDQHGKTGRLTACVGPKEGYYFSTTQSEIVRKYVSDVHEVDNVTIVDSGY